MNRKKLLQWDFRRIFHIRRNHKDVLREFLLKNRSEVVGMFLVDYKPSLQRKMDREEGYQEGFTKGEMRTQTQIVKNMIARKMPDEEIIALTECTQEFIDQLRKDLRKD